MAILVPRGLSNVTLILHFPLLIHSNFFSQSFLPLSLTTIPLLDPESNPSLSLQCFEWPTTRLNLIIDHGVEVDAPTPPNRGNPHPQA